MKKHLPSLAAASLFLVMAAVSTAREKADSLASVYGYVTGSTYYAHLGVDVDGAIVGANAMLVVASGEKTDTLYSVTDMDGLFIFRNIEPRTVRLRVTYVGKKTITGEYGIEAGRNLIFLEMENAPEELEGASVSADVPLMEKIADTVVYNAAAVTTMADENLRAMLEQLPGFKVDDREITVDGEPVKRTYVNGILIFGDNPVVALDAMKADEVSQVRVYDEQNVIDERRGRKHSRKERVLDIVTKERLLALSEAGVLAGGGADGTGKVRYAGAGALAYHSEMMQIDANVYANNLDIQSVQSDPGYLVMYSGGSSAVDNVLRQNSGFGRLSSDAESYGGKIGLEKYWKDRMYGNSVKASYSYGHHYEKNAATVLKEYFAGGGYPAGTEADTTSAGSVSGRHYATVAFDLKDTPLKSVGFEVSGNFGDSRNSFLNASRSITEGVGGELRRHETTTADARDYQISSSLDWSNNDETFMHPEFNLRFNSSNSSTLSWTVDTLATSFDRRQLSSDGFGRSMNASAGFSFTNFLVNTEKHSLSLSYGLSSVYSRTRSRQLTLDGYGVEIPVEDLANTYDYTWNDFSNSIIARMSYSSRGGLSVFGILEAANTFQFDDERYPDHWSDRRNYWGGSSVLQVNYRGFSATASLHSSTPSIEQTRNRISDSNPMSLTGGNPDLESEYDLYMDMSYNKMIAKGLGSVMAKLSTHAGFRNIVSKTTYFSQNTILSDWDGYEAIAGSRLYTFENADTPSLSGSVTVLGRGLFLKRKLTASLGFGSTVSSRPLYYGDELMNTNDVSGNATLSLSWRPSRTLKFDAGATAAYSKSSDRTAGLLSESMSASCSAGMTVRFAKYGTVDASYSFHNIDFIGGAGTDYVDRSLNAAISWGFMKRSLTVSLQGINLLDTGSVFTNQVTAESSVQTWKPIYGRYVILSLKYLFRKKS